MTHGRRSYVHLAETKNRNSGSTVLGVQILQRTNKMRISWNSPDTHASGPGGAGAGVAVPSTGRTGAPKPLINDRGSDALSGTNMTSRSMTSAVGVSGKSAPDTRGTNDSQSKIAYTPSKSLLTV